MDVYLHGACMGKLVGPAGGGGAGGSGGISTQFRVLPNSLPSDSHSIDLEKVPVGSHRPALHLRIHSPTPSHRTLSPEPLKIGDEHRPSSASSPIQDSNTGLPLLHDASAAVRRPSLTHSPSGSSSPPPKQNMDLNFVLGNDDGVPKTPNPKVR